MVWGTATTTPAADNAGLWATARNADGESDTTGSYPVTRISRAWDVRSTPELTVPGIKHRMETPAGGTRTAYTLYPDGSWARAAAPRARELPTVHQSGPRRLWDELGRIRTWLAIDANLPISGAGVRIAPDGTYHFSRSGWSATRGAPRVSPTSLGPKPRIRRPATTSRPTRVTGPGPAHSVIRSQVVCRHRTILFRRLRP
ncbi:hypothetical protein ACWGRF_08110 [Streptomyces zhihengii]